MIMGVLPVSGKALSIWHGVSSKPLLGNARELNSALSRRRRDRRGLELPRRGEEVVVPQVISVSGKYSVIRAAALSVIRDDAPCECNEAENAAPA